VVRRPRLARRASDGRAESELMAFCSTSLQPSGGHRGAGLIVGILAVSCGLGPAPAVAQENHGADLPKAEQAEERSTGLPSTLDWTFNFDAGWGSFGFGNSLFTNPKEGVEENLSDQWFEGYLKPALSGTYTFANSSQMYGKVSGVGERTYGSVPAAFGEDVSSFQVEDLAIGWRSGKSVDVKENTLDFIVGRAQYRLGHGFLLWDGAAEGGSRGGYWTNARKAFQFAAIGSFSPGHHKAEAFYLDKDELEENDSGSRLWGLNYEFSPAEQTTLGVAYMKWFAHADKKPGRDGLNVFNLRAYTAPIPNFPNLSFEFEYALEDNGDALDSNAWTVQGAYEFSDVTWKPKLSYRYAFFEGDDPATAPNESFDPLFLGFYDWGTWWQGEIAGEYFLSNSNLISHQFRAHVTPSDAISGGLMFFKFNIDQPAALGPDVTSKDAAFELDAYTDWKLNKNFTVSIVLAYADPEKAVQQLTGRTKNFAYGMVYLAYSY
jgi:hypothetical protein